MTDSAARFFGFWRKWFTFQLYTRSQGPALARPHNSVTEELREAEYRGEQEGDGTETEGEAHAPLAHLVLPAPLAARREALVRRHLQKVARVVTYQAGTRPGG